MEFMEMKIKLMENSFTEKEIEAINNCLKSGQYTQGKIVNEFEGRFAEWNGAKYAVMVNSGSSANLLIVFMLKEKYGLRDGDEVLVPAVTWPTTIYPVIQTDLMPVFCDIDESFNISEDSMKRMLTDKTKALFLVHLLGQPANMKDIVDFCKENNILLVEDCCESLGAIYNGIKVGNFGIMSSFSLYFGHHITTIEGGMILTNDSETYDLLKSARSHGWIRDSSRIGRYNKGYSNLNFVFDMLGYNLRSTNLNASIGLVQLEKLDSFIEIRKENHRLFKELISENKKIKLQRIELNETSSFSLGIILDSKEEKDILLEELPKKGIECRPVVAGNLLRQPVFTDKLSGMYRADDCKTADEINEKGLYLPNNQFINKEKIEYMVKCINDLIG